ncbi:MAG: serine/threonine protein kinase, partial [Deltaproteobacteria bacterium]|nr:serine/threonine protein kinase [Deltaproteobacteria bacterium]
MTAASREPPPGTEPPGYEVGTVLAGKYRIEALIGRGGMGRVLAATHLGLDELVAVKVLDPREAAKPPTLARFQREARAAARIRGEHVGRIKDVDALPDGTPFLVMEHLTGCDLSEETRLRGPLPLTEALSYLLQAMEAVAEAHAMGVVHRDLKPSNLFLSVRPDGSRSVKVLDFGISKLVDADARDVEVTTAFETLGSPLYMSPEQMRSARDVDERTDVWSLGVILYCLLAGKPPFPGTTVTDVCARILTDPTPSLAAVRADVPASLDAVLGRCLAKEPAERIPSVKALAAALGAFAPGEAALLDRILHLPDPDGAGPREHAENASLVTVLGGGEIDRGAVTVAGAPGVPAPPVPATPPR